MCRANDLTSPLLYAFYEREHKELQSNLIDIIQRCQLVIAGYHHRQINVSPKEFLIACEFINYRANLVLDNLKKRHGDLC